MNEWLQRGSMVGMLLAAFAVTGCSGDLIEAGLMEEALEGTWRSACAPRSGTYLSYREDVTFENTTSGIAMYTIVLGEWTTANCGMGAPADATTNAAGTFAFGLEVDCDSGYDGVCVELDLQPDSGSTEYTIFSVDYNAAPNVLYLPVGGDSEGTRPADVDPTDPDETLERR